MAVRNVVLFIAMSLDGYIADENGGVDWLAGQDPKEETADNYAEFEKSVDTVIMGWTTYHQIVTELSPERWVYEGMKSYVLTHRDCPSTEGIRFLSEDPGSLVRELKRQEGRDIWICGGADIVRQLMEQDLIDTYHISVIPAILGRGVRLFPEDGQKIDLRLVSVRSSNGITELIYRKR